MKILFVLENYYPNIGGVETLFKSLCENLVNKGFKVTVLTNKFAPHLKKKEVINGVLIHRVPFGNRYLFTFLGVFPAIRFALKNDLIHTTSYNAAIPAFFAGLFTGKKTVITFHEVWGKLWFDLPFMSRLVLWGHFIFEQFVLRLPFHRFVAVSKYTAQRLREAGVKEQKIETIPNGIDYSQFKINKTPRDNAVFQFVYFGRLGISKGLDILVESSRILKEKNIPFNLVIVIPTLPADFHQSIRDLIRDNKLDDRITIKSDLPEEELRSLLERSDAAVIPSYSEGFCFSAVESMALELPVISSGKGALGEVVGGKYIHSEELTAPSFAEAMEKGIRGQWDFKEIRKFKLKDTIDNYIKLYRSFEK